MSRMGAGEREMPADAEESGRVGSPDPKSIRMRIARRRMRDMAQYRERHPEGHRALLASLESDEDREKRERDRRRRDREPGEEDYAPPLRYGD